MYRCYVQDPTGYILAAFSICIQDYGLSLPQSEAECFPWMLVSGRSQNRVWCLARN